MTILLGLLVLGQLIGLLLTGAVVHIALTRYLRYVLDDVDGQLALVSLSALFLYRLAIFLVFGLEFLHLLGYGTLTITEQLVLPVFITFFWLVSAMSGYLLVERWSRKAGRDG